MLWLSLAILLIGIIRLRVLATTESSGAPIDETYHFGWVLDTTAALSLPGLDLNGHALQIELQQNNLRYTPQEALPTFSIFREYWRGIGVYIVHAIIQSITPISGLTERLYLARFVNVCLAVILAWAAYGGITRAINNRQVALAVAALLSFTPTLSTSAASVTPEIGALTACLVLFIGLADLYRNGWSLRIGLELALGCLACLVTKNTSWPLIGVIGIMILRRAGLSWRAVFIAGLFPFAVAVTQLEPQGAAHWYRQHIPWTAWSNEDTFLANVDGNLSQLGSSSLHLDETSADRPVIQNLSEMILARMRGKVVTIGSWVRASAGASIVVPVLQQAHPGSEFIAVPGAEVTVIASGEWQFTSYRVEIPATAGYARLALWQMPGTATPVWYDSLVITVGEWDSASPPQFSNEAATQGTWGNRPFQNLLLNGSAEYQWWGVDSAKWTREYPINQRLFAWQDLSRTGPAYLTAARAIFVTLWGSFQNDMPGVTRWQAALIGILVMVGMVGQVIETSRNVRSGLRAQISSIPSWVLECWVLWICTYILIAFFRSDVSGAWINPFFSASGRFILPVLFPLFGLTLTGFGWLSPRRWQSGLLAGLVAAFFLLNIWMLLRVEWPYYYCEIVPRWSCIAALY